MGVCPSLSRVSLLETGPLNKKKGDRFIFTSLKITFAHTDGLVCLLLFPELQGPIGHIALCTGWTGRSPDSALGVEDRGTQQAAGAKPETRTVYHVSAEDEQSTPAFLIMLHPQC